MTHAETAAEPPERLSEWLDALARHLQLDDTDIPIAELLDTARVVAHSVARPAAPLSALLIGIAAARDGGGVDAVRDAAARTAAFADEWAGARKD